MAELQGKDFIAVRRLSDVHSNTIAAVGETCERVPAATSGGTVSEALQRLWDSGHIKPAPKTPKAAAPTQVPAPATKKETGDVG